jgi:putative oxidoreductase
MDRWLGRYADVIYSGVRVVVGLLFWCHGAQKLFGMFGGQAELSVPLLATAGVIEFVGGGLIFLGLWTSYAAFIASGEMAVAYFKVHAPHALWPVVNKGELAVLYCFILLYIASRGSGRLSVDALIRKLRA